MVENTDAEGYIKDRYPSLDVQHRYRALGLSMVFYREQRPGYEGKVEDTAVIETARKFEEYISGATVEPVVTDRVAEDR